VQRENDRPYRVVTTSAAQPLKRPILSEKQESKKLHSLGTAMSQGRCAFFCSRIAKLVQPALRCDSSSQSSLAGGGGKDVPDTRWVVLRQDRTITHGTREVPLTRITNVAVLERKGRQAVITWESWQPSELPLQARRPEFLMKSPKAVRRTRGQWRTYFFFSPRYRSQKKGYNSAGQLAAGAGRPKRVRAGDEFHSGSDRRGNRWSVINSIVSDYRARSVQRNTEGMVEERNAQ